MPFIDNEVALYRLMIDKLKNEELFTPYTQQLSHSYLKSLRANKKVNLFDEFEENLSRLDIGLIEKIIRDLSILDIPCGHSERLIEYLCFLKKEPNLFIKSMLKCIA